MDGLDQDQQLRGGKRDSCPDDERHGCAGPVVAADVSEDDAVEKQRHCDQPDDAVHQYAPVAGLHVTVGRLAVRHEYY